MYVSIIEIAREGLGGSLRFQHLLTYEWLLQWVLAMIRDLNYLRASTTTTLSCKPLKVSDYDIVMSLALISDNILLL